MIITPEALLHDLPVVALPRRVYCYERTTSTMDVARAHIREAADDEFPLLVLTETQEAGRGRRGRIWVAPPHSSLIFSLVLRPVWLTYTIMPSLVWLMSVALCEAIEEHVGIAAVVKWPNDVLIPMSLPNDTSPYGKVAGILIESSSDAHTARPAWAIIGCGVNVNATPPTDIPLRRPATCLAVAGNHPISRLDLLRTLLVQLDYWYGLLAHGESSTLFDAWRSRLITLDTFVEIEMTDGTTLCGYAEAVDSSGALQVRDSMGIQHSVTSGDL